MLFSKYMLNAVFLMAGICCVVSAQAAVPQSAWITNPWQVNWQAEGVVFVPPRAGDSYDAIKTDLLAAKSAHDGGAQTKMALGRLTNLISHDRSVNCEVFAILSSAFRHGNGVRQNLMLSRWLNQFIPSDVMLSAQEQGLLFGKWSREMSTQTECEQTVSDLMEGSAAGASVCTVPTLGGWRSLELAMGRSDMVAENAVAAQENAQKMLAKVIEVSSSSHETDENIKKTNVELKKTFKKIRTTDFTLKKLLKESGDTLAQLRESITSIPAVATVSESVSIMLPVAVVAPVVSVAMPGSADGLAEVDASMKFLTQADLINEFSRAVRDNDELRVLDLYNKAIARDGAADTKTHKNALMKRLKKDGTLVAFQKMYVDRTMQKFLHAESVYEKHECVEELHSVLEDSSVDHPARFELAGLYIFGKGGGIFDELLAGRYPNLQRAERLLLPALRSKNVQEVGNVAYLLAVLEQSRQNNDHAVKNDDKITEYLNLGARYGNERAIALQKAIKNSEDGTRAYTQKRYHEALPLLRAALESSLIADVDLLSQAIAKCEQHIQAQHDAESLPAAAGVALFDPAHMVLAQRAHMQLSDKRYAAALQLYEQFSAEHHDYVSGVVQKNIASCKAHLVSGAGLLVKYAEKCIENPEKMKKLVQLMTPVIVSLGLADTPETIVVACKQAVERAYTEKRLLGQLAREDLGALVRQDVFLDLIKLRIVGGDVNGAYAYYARVGQEVDRIACAAEWQALTEAEKQRIADDANCVVKAVGDLMKKMLPEAELAERQAYLEKSIRNV